jgi:hypothetical protein
MPLDDQIVVPKADRNGGLDAGKIQARIGNAPGTACGLGGERLSLPDAAARFRSGRFLTSTVAIAGELVK